MNLQNQIKYLHEMDMGDMFEGCSVPAPLDMARVRGAIVMRCGLLTPLYIEPQLQRDATQQFFYENQWNFEHIVKVLLSEYSPIENVDEVRNEKTQTGGADTLTISRNSTETHSGTDERQVQESGTTGSNESGQTTVTNEISAENASAYQADNKSTTAHGKGETVTHGKGTSDNLTHGETITHGGSDTHRQDKNSSTDYEVRRHGNIGVTTNQEMINQELRLLENFNAYRYIADMYERELMLGIY